MKLTIFLLTFFLTWSNDSIAQNRTTKQGLKYGKWSTKYKLANRKFRATGLYKIVPIDTYDTIHQEAELMYKVIYKGSTNYWLLSGRHDKSVSVKDGIWQIFDAKGKLYMTEYWMKGLLLWSKSFEENGNLTEYNNYGIENDSVFYLTYKNNQLFKKVFYKKEIDDKEIEIYYPDNNLIIVNAEPSFSSKFGDTVGNVYHVKLFCKKDLTINSVTSSSENLKLDFRSNSVPFEMTSKDSAIFNITYTPTPTSFSPTDTITISTSEEYVLPYKIYCSLKAAHIDADNVETLDELTLSKTQDRYLFISAMGSQTDVSIKSYKGKEKSFRIHEIEKIDLSKYKLGEYSIQIVSCDIGGYIQLKIIE